MHYELLIAGGLALDTNTDYDGVTVKAVGGGAYYAAFAAAAAGVKTAALIKANPKDVDLREAFAGVKNVTAYPVESTESTRIQNTYLTKDRERRVSRQTNSCPPFALAEFPEDLTCDLYDLSGLCYGEFPEELIIALSKRAPVAMDAQSVLRNVENTEIVFRDWPDKKATLPYIRYLKTDENEVQVLTGIQDRVEAAKQVVAWGCPEVMVTHNSEVIIATPDSVYRQPLRPRSLAGRTGRGDTTFASYLSMRLHHGIEESLAYAAACVSLKMETPGPFQGSAEDVRHFYDVFYRGKTDDFPPLKKA